MNSQSKKHLLFFSKKTGRKNEFPLGLDFFSYFVHELKAPLMSLKFKVDQMKASSQKKEDKDTLYQMERDISQLFRFIHDSLEMKELENKTPIKSKWISLNEILNRNKNKFNEWIYNDEIQIDIVHQNSDLHIYMNSWWFDSIITNLIINAIQHSPRKGRIEIESKVLKNGDIQISVKDEGEGISNKLSSTIFNKFSSGRKKWSQSILKGTGLGLYIAKSIVEGYQGEIGFQNVQEKNQKGCVFYFALPQSRVSLNKKTS